MDRPEGKTKLIIFIAAIAVLFAGVTVVTAAVTKKAVMKKAFSDQTAGQTEQAADQTEQDADEAAGDTGAEEQNAAAESGDAQSSAGFVTAAGVTIDKYSMQEYCAENAKAVFTALKSGDRAALESLMVSTDGIDSVMDFADWSSAEFDTAVSMGSGSLTFEPDESGRMDESERFFVKAYGAKYVFFIETLTSDYGRVNDGVSAVGVISFADFDAGDYKWNGEKDGKSALAGELYWDSRP